MDILHSPLNTLDEDADDEKYNNAAPRACGGQDSMTNVITDDDGCQFHFGYVWNSPSINIAINVGK